jgi:AraC-like DNA-binding protein
MHVLSVESAEEFEHIVSESLGPVALSVTRPDFRGRLALQDLSTAASVTEAYSGPVRALRTTPMAARMPRDDLLLFCVHLSGPGRVHQHDRVAELSPGAGVLYEARAACEMDFPTDMRSVTLQFPRDQLPVQSSRISEYCARRLDPQSATMRLLTSYFSQLHALAGEFSGEQRLDAGQAAIDMVAMVMRGIDLTVPSSEGASDVLLRMMRLHVRDHLADRRLTVQELARRHHISVRHTYTLFEQMDTTPGAFIREQRLLAAQAMLSDSRNNGRPVLEIAASVGFGEITTFERAFRRAYGMSPGRWRHERTDTVETVPRRSAGLPPMRP